ncbi:MAG: signal peptidase II [Pseudohongiellaceae bacterium]
MFLFSVIALSVLALSQAIGYLIDHNIPQNASVEITSFVHFTHVRNYGGVFGLLQGSGWLFALISFSLLAAVVVYLWKAKSLPRYEYICFGFIVGGGASNILDRLIYGAVIDFIDIRHIPFWNYIFNTADVMIHVGIWPMLILTFLSPRARQQGDL